MSLLRGFRRWLSSAPPTGAETMLEPVGYGGVPDAVARSCFDCGHCKASGAWWCTEPNAIRANGTNIPGRSGCQFWTPIRVLPLRADARDVVWVNLGAR